MAGGHHWEEGLIQTAIFERRRWASCSRKWQEVVLPAGFLSALTGTGCHLVNTHIAVSE